MSAFKMRELLDLLKMDQFKVKKYVTKQLKKAGYMPIVADGFVYAEGDIPIGMIAHMDTVCTAPPRWVNNDNGVISNSNKKDCLGADDRAGIYGILHLIREGYRPTVIFTEDEEIGCVGADKFAQCGFELDLNYLIELDRQGIDDAVYYECDNVDFEDYITSFGFKTAMGSYSDISKIAPQLGVSAVNLSIGYHGQHTSREILIISQMLRTIKRVSTMLDDANGVKFEWVDKSYKKYFTKEDDWFDKKWGASYTAKWHEDDDYEDDDSYHTYSSANTLVNLKIVPVVDCWINYTTGDYDFVEADGSELLFIGNDDNVYDSVGKEVQVILFSDDYHQLYYEDMVKINKKIADRNKRY